MIEPKVVDEVEVDLCVAGIAAAGGDADGAAALAGEADFVAQEFA